MKKKVQHVLTGKDKAITPDETVYQPLPHRDFRFANPFIVLHHLRPRFIRAGMKLRTEPHPHRGFSPVTFLLQGEGFHKDSAGNSQEIYTGDVQWLFAGSGVLHSEGPTDRLLTQGGVYELIQLWINVPGAHKWDKPFYQFARSQDQPLIEAGPGAALRLACGTYKGMEGPLFSFTPLSAMSGSLSAGSATNLYGAEGNWTLLYLVSGRMTVNGEGVQEHQLVVFAAEGTDIEIDAVQDSFILFLSATPIEEPIAAQGNFVMNTQSELDQAMDDYANGLFGSLDY